MSGVSGLSRVFSAAVIEPAPTTEIIPMIIKIEYNFLSLDFT
jgi:hypothetical protein